MAVHNVAAILVFVRRELAEGRASIDIIEDLEARGLTPREAEAIVDECDNGPAAARKEG